MPWPCVGLGAAVIACRQGMYQTAGRKQFLPTRRSGTVCCRTIWNPGWGWGQRCNFISGEVVSGWHECGVHAGLFWLQLECSVIVTGGCCEAAQRVGKIYLSGLDFFDRRRMKGPTESALFGPTWISRGIQWGSLA